MDEATIDRHTLLSHFERDVRAVAPEMAEDRPFEIDGPIMRVRFANALVVFAPTDLGVDGPQLEALIERQVRASAHEGLPLEWKTFADDRPATLVPLLLAAGFEPEPTEAVMVAPTAGLAARELPAGVAVTELDDADFPRVADLLSQVWGADHAWLLTEFAELRRLRGDGFRVLAAQLDGELASVGWIVMHPGSSFAGLWGGSTAPDARGRGLYRALVVARARIAADAGVPFLHVDAASSSRPILSSLGFAQLTTTTPYLWSPGSA